MSHEAAVHTDRHSREAALLPVLRSLASHRTIPELFHVLASHLHRVVPFDYLSLLLHDEQHDELRLVVLEPAEIVPPFVTRSITETGPAATAWKTQQAAVIPISDARELPPGLAFLRSQGRKMTCWLPLSTADRRLGVLAFGSRSATAYTGDVLTFMAQVAAGVALAVDNSINREQAQRYEIELREQRDRLRFLLEINNLLVSQLDYRSLHRVICETVASVVEADFIGVALIDDETGQLRLNEIYDKAHGFSTSRAVAPVNESAAGVTLQNGVGGLFRRSEMEALGWDGAAVMKAKGIESLCCVPLVTRKARLGALYVGNTRPDEFSDDDVRLLGQASAQIAIAIENSRAYDRILSVNEQLTDERDHRELDLQREFGEILGVSPALHRVLKAVKTVANTDSTVLLLGETGTGKELIARSVHRLSARSARTFIRANVAALPTTLFESELFGYEKGAFTGATASRAGRLELANRGTLFLDEVGDIPLEMQPKLLRVLQEREFERLGSTRTQQVDVRIVAATNRDLEHMAEDGTFRNDLYYRLNVFPIEIPPLRDRVDDIPVLVRHFTQQCARRLGRPVPSIPDDAMDALMRWRWPGNIRELQNMIERAVILTSGPNLVLPLQDLRRKTKAAAPHAKPTLQDAERDAILRALRDSGGVIAGPSGAAARLGLRRTTLQSKMRKLGIRRPSF